MGVTQSQSKKFLKDHDYDLEEDDEYYVTRPHTSARRYSQPSQRDTLDDDAITKGPFIQQRRSRVNSPHGDRPLAGAAAPSGRQGWRHSRRFTLITVIVGMLVMAVLFLTHARIYNGPTLFGDGQDLTPVTAEFGDVNGDGKPDMIVHIQDQRLVFINDGTQFRPLQQGEHVNL